MLDDEDDDFEEFYENGEWVWDDHIGGLCFVKHTEVSPTPTAINVATKATSGALAFRDDIDLLQQHRFQKYYARKVQPGEPNIITLQDVKDLAIFTAPPSILSPMLINMLHKPTTERFIRALILYCQYYLQVEERMTNRLAELDKKIRTPESEKVEAVYRENLCDLRALVAQQYSIILMGAAETSKLHHLGARKTWVSMNIRDAKLFETMLRVAIQIVWLALTRRSFEKLELEINRLFKTEHFSSVEHHRNEKMHKTKASVLLGGCLRHDKKLHTCSPLINEATCKRKIDYRMMGLGVIQYEGLSQRLTYMLLAIAGPESELSRESVVVGILGLPRAHFDTMLNVLPATSGQHLKHSSASTGSSRGSRISRSKAPVRGSSKSVSGVKNKVTQKFIYGEVILPAKETNEPPLPDEFPIKSMRPLPCHQVQRLRWQKRLSKLVNPQLNRRSTFVD